jgi:hypothetical protein
MEEIFVCFLYFSCEIEEFLPMKFVCSKRGLINIGSQFFCFDYIKYIFSPSILFPKKGILKRKKKRKD